MRRIKVLVAEDETVVRYALAQLLGAEDDISVVGEAADGQMAVAPARQSVPDIVLMDLGMSRLDGIEATRQIKEHLSDCGIVVLTVFADDEHLFRAIKAGADGYVLKDAPPDQLVSPRRRLRLPAQRPHAHGEYRHLVAEALQSAARQRREDHASHGDPPPPPTARRPADAGCPS